MTIPISELFLSFQGEGPRAGRTCYFIRTGGCNLSCSFCDTPYSWNAALYDLRRELTPMAATEIVDQVPGDVDEIVITGGEPLMHQRNPQWLELLRTLHRQSKFICVETNGTIAPNQGTQTFIDHYSISPKLENAGEHKRSQNPDMALWPDRLRYHNTCLKFVVEDAKDVRKAVCLSDDLGWRRDKVWMMPEGTDEATLLKRWPEIVTESIAHRVNVTMRLQVLAFGDTRGT